MSLDLFKEILPSILQTKVDLLKTPEDEKAYVPFVINRAMSNHPDCILLVNEMNLVPHLDKKLQFHFLLNTTRSWKRPFKKWMKLEKSDDLEAIKVAYGYSDSKAREVLSILSEDQKVEIRKTMDRGGINGHGKQSANGAGRRTK